MAAYGEGSSALPTDAELIAYVHLDESTEAVIIGPSTCTFRPSTDASQTLGSSRYYWSTIYCDSSAVDLSDRNRKENISYDMTAYSGVFDRLKPVSFKFKGRTRTHTGLIAQEVEEAIIAEGLSSVDMAALCYDDFDDGTRRYALRYGEFISLLIYEVQQLKAKVQALESAAATE